MSSKFLDKTGLDTLWAKIKSTFQTLGNLVTAWGSTPSDTKYPSEKLVKTSLDAISTNARTIPQDISKGANLVVNGSGVMGNNYNWYACSFNANTDLPEGVAGCFHRSGGDFFQEEKIAINTSKSYIVESWYRVKTANTSTVRLTVACYDVDAKSISAIYSTYGVGTLTQLTEDLKPGDTVVHLADLSNSNWKSATNYHHGFIFWNYKNSYGYQYPPETYSRNVYPSSGTVYLWTNASQVDQTNNTITLDSAWSGPSIPAGTYVSRRNSGSTYYYAKTSATSGALTTWTKLSGLVKGFVTPGGTDGGCFRPGTAFIRIGWVNANTSGNEWFEFAGCELREIPEQISGTLPVANGGTGKTSVTAGNYLVGNGTSALTEKTPKQVGNNVLPALDAGSDNVLDTDYIIASNHTSGATDATTFVRRTAGKLWNYIKGQISSVLGLTATDYDGNAATATTATTAAGYTSGGAIDNALQGKQDDLGISSSGDTTKYLNEKGQWATPTGTAQVQSDWNQTTTTAVDYIKNKPDHFAFVEGQVAAADVRNTMTVRKSASNAAVLSSGDGTTATNVYIRPKGSASEDNQVVVLTDGSISLKYGSGRIGTFKKTSDKKGVIFSFPRTNENSHSSIRLSWCYNYVAFEVILIPNHSSSGFGSDVRMIITRTHTTSSAHLPTPYTRVNGSNDELVLVWDNTNVYRCSWEYRGDNADDFTVSSLGSVPSSGITAVEVNFYPSVGVTAVGTAIGSVSRPTYVDDKGRLQACDFDDACKPISQLSPASSSYDTTTTEINSTHILQATLSTYVINIKRLKVGQVYKFMFLEGSNSGQVYLCNGNGSNFSYASGPNGGTTKKLSLNGGSHGSSYTSYVIRDSDTSVYHIWGY